MPPEENKLKVDIDPVFRGSQTRPQNNQDNSATTGAYGILNNQQYTTDQNQIPRTTNLSPTSNKTNNEKKSIVRTYKDDIASAIQANHLSSINIAIAENEKMHSKIESPSEEESEELNSPYSKSKILVLISVILVIIGIVAIATTYFLAKEESAPVVKSQVLTSLITTEYKDELDTNTVVRDRFVSALSSRVNDVKIPANNIYNVYITAGTSSAKRLISAKEFVTLAELGMPDMINRTLVNEFMVGMFSSVQNLPFVIFKTSSFENTYAGMFEWERKLERDFSSLFRLNINTDYIATSSTPSPVRKFEDGVIVNKDIRLLRNQEGKIIFLYAILDKDTIVITVNDSVFKEIVSRLNKEKGLKR